MRGSRSEALGNRATQSLESRLQSSTLAHRRGPWAFVAGVIAVTAGVLLHMPMFLMGRHNHFDLSGMAMGADMIAGMVMIVSGVAVAAYGLLPRNVSHLVSASHEIVVSAPEDAPLSRAHWALMAVLGVALIIDIMKPASLGFTIPGMVDEYGVPAATASLVPFFALPAPWSDRSCGASSPTCTGARRRSFCRR